MRANTLSSCCHKNNRRLSPFDAHEPTPHHLRCPKDETKLRLHALVATACACWSECQALLIVSTCNEPDTRHITSWQRLAFQRRGDWPFLKGLSFEPRPESISQQWQLITLKGATSQWPTVGYDPRLEVCVGGAVTGPKSRRQNSNLSSRRFEKLVLFGLYILASVL